VSRWIHDESTSAPPVTADDRSARHVLRSIEHPVTAVSIGEIRLGAPGFVVVAGPCAVESAEQLEIAASTAVAAGAHLLRGGAFKPRTSPYAFAGLGESALRILRDAGRRHRLPTVAEVMEVSQVPLMLDYVDVLQVGARNMQNFSLLRALSRVRCPVLLKRGFCATVHEWFLAAEYLLDGGNDQVILCERGIRTFESHARNTLDLSAVAYAKLHTHLPVLVDPSHATGDRDLVTPMALAAAACGADGIMVELHPHPEQALCDGAQALTPEQFIHLISRLRPVLGGVGRQLWQPQSQSLAARSE
jgi:3-deoxy-7-phosphoheptulonate synthase